ncbi:probable serine/threonine-protein kinase cdc7 [Lucilia sericata]|uniref:probable serine/threonine-protein kinase cdc7 n=1 Tax=Lucilia sericata TaxID=13632 RepID=UPI0018A86678|nr:probable serine/threonine-protein kinase cdc7 [Lucilia sericata]
MSSAEYNTTYAAPDMLQLNMENISKELNDLIVTGEQEFGMTQQFPAAASSNGMANVATVMQSNFQVPAYSKPNFQLHQPFAANGMQFLKHNLNYFGALQQSMTFANNTYNNFAASQTTYTPSYAFLKTGKNFGHSTLGSSQVLNTNVTETPTYEFHYLRSNGEHEKKFSASCTSLGSTGVYRKIPRFAHKHFQQKLTNAVTENDHIMLDLSLIDLSNNNNDNSTVRHLFELLRDLHCALAETPPSSEANENSQYVETFAPADAKKSAMPSTLNVQNQVKQACRKLSIFICDMQRLLGANKMFDLQMHAECEFYLSTLRQYLNQLELYKSIEMEHKRGQFLKDKIKAHAERLSLLLEHINRQIREVNIRLVAFDWYIGVKYRGDVALTASACAQTNDNNLKENSKIGVINEILQMCNTPTTPSSLIQSTNNLNTQMETTTTTTKAEMTNIIIETPQNKLINSNKEEEPLLNNNNNNNNNIFNIYKPDQIRKLASAVNTTTPTTTYNHNRHPFFYIG